MQPYTILEPEYAAQIARARIRAECEAPLHQVAVRLLRDKATYDLVFEKTGVPIAMLMALSEREMSGNIHCYLGNGQSLKMRTTIVPKNRGPFPQWTPEDFVAGALDSLHLDGLDQVALHAGWSMTMAAYESEEWNGTGYRRPPDGGPPIPSPYLVGGTTVQLPGTFIRDHVFARVMDPQLGTIAIIEKLIELDPSLSFDKTVITKIDAPPIVPMLHPVIGDTDVSWVQGSLNEIHADGTPLLVDGNCGPGTRAAVRAFEIKHHLTVDRGWPGPQVVGALKALAA
jgi:lysozyme family protein